MRCFFCYSTVVRVRSVFEGEERPRTFREQHAMSRPFFDKVGRLPARRRRRERNLYTLSADATRPAIAAIATAFDGPWTSLPGQQA